MKSLLGKEIAIDRVGCFQLGILFVLLFQPWQLVAQGAPTGLESGGGTIVEDHEQISDFDTRLQLARSLAHDKHKRHEALKQYRILHRQAPQQKEVALELAQLCVELEHYNEAAALLKSLRAQDPEDFDVALLLAQSELWRRAYPEAIAVLEELLARNPESREVRLALARAELWSDNHLRARRHYKWLLTHRTSTSADLLSEYAETFLYAGEHDAAMQSFSEALQLDPEHFGAAKGLALAYSWSGLHAKALPLLEKLVNKIPEDINLKLAFARALAYQDRGLDAAGISHELIGEAGLKFSQTQEMAEIEAVLGHAQHAQEIYTSIYEKILVDDEALRRYADSLSSWGDFWEAESILRDQIKAQPEASERSLRLAQLLIDTERYEEAEELYRLMALDPDYQTELQGGKPEKRQGLLIALGHLKRAAKDLSAALGYADQVVSESQHKSSAWIAGVKLQATLLLKSWHYEQAAQKALALSDIESQSVAAHLLLGEIFNKQEQNDKAATHFETVIQLEPSDIRSAFFMRVMIDDKGDELLEELLNNEKEALKLLRWGALFAETGLLNQALKLYQAACNLDSDNLMAHLLRAETLANAHYYDEAVELFEGLNRKHPDNRRILLGWARALGWSNQFEESIELYEALQKKAPSDPLLKIERARVAAWGKMEEESYAGYESLYEIPVDTLLIEALAELSKRQKEQPLESYLEECQADSDEDSIYQLYERVMAEKSQTVETLTEPTAREFEREVSDLWAEYLIHKRAYIEQQAKAQKLNLRHRQAIKTYQELVSCAPGNQEARFDLAQVYCAVDHGDRAAEVYQELLTIEPLHNRAPLALRKELSGTNPSLGLKGSHWREAGRGAVSRIRRQLGSAGLELPVVDRLRFYLGADFYNERPDFNKKDYQAFGSTLGVEAIFNPYLRARGRWQRKDYEDDFDSTDRGLAQLQFNFYDYLDATLSLERTDELYNYFGLDQSVQADRLRLDLLSPLSRRLELQGKAEYLDYSDTNSAEHFKLAVGYQLTEHPRIFKLSLSGERRDTAHETQEILEQDNLVNLIHPYWTPQDYWGAELTFEWYHDLSELFFCGLDKHFYDLKLSVGHDTEENPKFQFEVLWNYEFLEHWQWRLRALVHRSERWDAEGVWLALAYRF